MWKGPSNGIERPWLLQHMTIESDEHGVWSCALVRAKNKTQAAKKLRKEWPESSGAVIAKKPGGWAPHD